MGINAGLDMVMVPFEYARFMRAVEAGIETGRIPVSRIEDACRRILQVKAAVGLFDDAFGDANRLAEVGSETHRAVAREAVSKSQVLLKNEAAALPLSRSIRRLLVAGAAADDIGLQCGGWTIEWQGRRGAITTGTTLLQGINKSLSPGASVVFHPDGEFGGARGNIGIVVVNEPPYSEGEGDQHDLSLPADDVELVRRVRGQCDVLVLVIYSVRPLIIGEVLDSCDAIVASWLPGTEAHGIADVLFGKQPFAGRLPYDWPETMDDVRSRNGRAPLFPISYGLTAGGPPPGPPRPRPAGARGEDRSGARPGPP